MYHDCLEEGAELIIECDGRLVPLFGRSFPASNCIPRLRDKNIVEEIASGVDSQINSGNLAQWLRPDVHSFPKRRSFLIADEDQRGMLRKRYKGDSNDVLVGIAWESKETESALNKSVSLDNWHSILSVPGIKFINIQYGDTSEQRSKLQAQTGVSIIHNPEIDPLEDLDSAAAQIAALDLVISTSNAAAHLSGALGVPTWVMLSVNPHWYWMLDREDSPWYPSTRLFRQVIYRQWSDVTQRVAKELNDFVENPTDRQTRPLPFSP